MATEYYEATHKFMKGKKYLADVDLPERLIAELLDTDPVLDNWDFVLLDVRGEVKKSMDWRDIRVDSRLGEIFKYD